MNTEKVNTLQDYQRLAMRTCTPSSRNLQYMTLEIVSEAGEIAGKVAKAIRDHNSTFSEQMRRDMLHEIGDVMWGVAGAMEVTGRKLEQYTFIPYRHSNKNVSLFELALDICIGAWGFVQGINDGAIYGADIDMLIFNLDIMARQMGADLHTALQMNIDKLTDRYNRGALSGSGDNR